MVSLADRFFVFLIPRASRALSSYLSVCLPAPEKKSPQQPLVSLNPAATAGPTCPTAGRQGSWGGHAVGQPIIKPHFYGAAISHSLPAFLSHEVSRLRRLEGEMRNPPEGLAPGCLCQEGSPHVRPGGMRGGWLIQIPLGILKIFLSCV